MNGPAEVRALTAATTLTMYAHPTYPEEVGQPGVLFRSELTAPPVPEERRAQMANRESFHAYLLSHGWQRIERTMVQRTDNHGWQLRVLLTPGGINCAVLHQGIPWLFSGALFTDLGEDARVWLSRVEKYRYAELVYMTDTGRIPGVDEYERLLAQRRAYVIAVPVRVQSGV